MFKISEAEDVALLRQMMTLDNNQRITARDVLVVPCIAELDSRISGLLGWTREGEGAIVVPLDEVDPEALRHRRHYNRTVIAL
jgi:hypothetical protein